MLVKWNPQYPEKQYKPVQSSIFLSKLNQAVILGPPEKNQNKPLVHTQLNANQN